MWDGSKRLEMIIFWKRVVGWMAEIELNQISLVYIYMSEKRYSRCVDFEVREGNLFGDFREMRKE